MKRWLVTGAGGFVGLHFLDSLNPRSERACGLVLPGAPSLPRNIQTLRADLTDFRAMRRVVRKTKPTHVLHLAAISSLEECDHNRPAAWLSNVGGTLSLLEAVRAEAPKARCLVISSAQVYRPSSKALSELSPTDPPNFYGVTKLQMEQFARFFSQTGLWVAIARPFNHFGPGQSERFVAAGLALQVARIELGLQEPRLRVGNLNSARDFLDVRDVIPAYRRIIDRGKSGECYNVCSGQAVPVSRLVELLRRHSRVALTMQAISSKMRKGEHRVLLGSANKLKRDCGWKQEISIEQSLGDLLEEKRSYFFREKLD